jgi:hypothetical protein
MKDISEREYQAGYDAYMQSYNSNDTTDALFQMVKAMQGQIYDLQVEIKNLKASDEMANCWDCEYNTTFHGEHSCSCNHSKNWGYRPQKKIDCKEFRKK